MEPGSSGQGVAEAAEHSYQIHNLETVTEEEDNFKEWPLLVEDSTKSQLSRPLTRLLQQLDRQVQPQRELTTFDVLFTIAYCVGLEAGYVPVGHKLTSNQPLSRYASFDRRILTIFSTIIPSNFYNRESRSYRLDFTLNSDDQQRCSLVGIKSGDFLCLTFTILNRTDLPGRSLFLPVSRFVPLLNFHKLPLSCQNLLELSHKLKNGLFTPVRDDLCQDADAALYPSLYGLPDEVLALLVRTYLGRKDRARLGATCGRLRELVKMYRPEGR
uniref:Protein nutcracker n=1 Tax=Culex pipiens TaxID=7175 RepID=A0A8D7ZVD5_CULPI